MATKGIDQAQPHPWDFRWRPAARNDGSQGLLTTLMADLKRKQLPTAEDHEYDAWYEAEQEERRQFAARVGTAHNISVDRRESFRRRYWNQ